MDDYRYNNIKSWLLARVNKKITGNDVTILVDLIKRHPSYDTWKHQVPIGFKIQQKKSLQLLVVFENMKKYRVVSWVACCSDKKRQVVDPLTSAMRHAIRRQINMFKSKNAIKQCVLCNTTKSIEVDHHPLPFCQIKSDFVNNHTAPTAFNYHAKRCVYLFTAKDKPFKLAWQRYHNHHAQYRYLCSTCNKHKK